MPNDRRINVNIIRIFEGPRHRQLELLWKWYADQHAGQMSLHVFDNTQLRLPHDRAYERIWELESRRTEPYTIITEFDFLPGPDFLRVLPETMWAAQYVTRDPHSKDLKRHLFPGAWYVAAKKDQVPEHPHFRNAGPFNDPCNDLDCEYLETDDCYPRHYGVKVFTEFATRKGLDRYEIGEHLFWSRHYNDPPDSWPAGFHLRPILEGVDRAIYDWLQ
jgi:hypothetical protein